MARLLSQQLELDSLRPGYYKRHKSNLYGTETVYRIAQRAVFGAAFLITQIAKEGGADPVLKTWAERGPSPALRAKAAMALECVQLNRQRMLNAYSASCAAPGEVCTDGRCSKIFGEKCSAGIECFSNTCEGGHCCQPLGLSCTGTACCAPGSCVAGQCSASSTSGGAQAR